MCMVKEREKEESSHPAAATVAATISRRRTRDMILVQFGCRGTVGESKIRMSVRPRVRARESLWKSTVAQDPKVASMDFSELSERFHELERGKERFTVKKVIGNGQANDISLGQEEVIRSRVPREPHRHQEELANESFSRTTTPPQPALQRGKFSWASRYNRLRRKFKLQYFRASAHVIAAHVNDSRESARARALNANYRNLCKISVAQLKIIKNSTTSYICGMTQVDRYVHIATRCHRARASAIRDIYARDRCGLQERVFK
ncbi:unnamed protein product [Trichogramma brassicae]|uniref:Uncharacterized protein n=1 Tax=Trichogramma brassicae TaxID=86971 RepID=A0A6H5I538_9HYME|nr:unnamed protein product [Trichogramma brassicae]